jgi:hypothetical protein
MKPFLTICALLTLAILQAPAPPVPAPPPPVPPNPQPVTKQRCWGWELWTLGNSQPGVSFTEAGPVSLRSMHGYLSYSANVAARPSYQGEIMRQVLCCLYSPERTAAWKPDLTALSPQTPNNNSVSPNLWQCNIKQRLEQSGTIPIDVTWDPPIPLTGNHVYCFVANAAYYWDGKALVVSTSNPDALDVEFQVLVTYDAPASN